MSLACIMCSDDEGDRDCPIDCGCECHDPDPDADDERNAPCIGTDCCNPHPFHGRDECVTVEMMEAHMNADESPERDR